MRAFYKRNLPKKLVETSALLINKSSDNRPYVSIKISQNIVALLDNGSTNSIIGSLGIKVMESLDIAINPPLVDHISTADGFKQKITCVIDLPVVVDNVCRIIKAFVVPSLPHSFILGSDFCGQFKLKVDFLQGTWRVQSGTSNCLLNVFPTADKLCPSNSIQLFSLSELSDEDRARTEEVIKSFDNISSEKHGLGRTNIISFNIDTGDSKPFRERQ